MHMVCRSESLLQRVPALILFRLFYYPRPFLRIRRYSAHRFREQLKENDVQAVIPPIQRGSYYLIEYDNYLYKMRYIIENTF